MNISPAPIHVDGDADRLAQVIGHLLLNASWFTGCGEQVRISLAKDDAGRFGVVRITDTGVGISPELLPRLFQPFVQAKDTRDHAYGGLGLGLALAKGLAELHGGQISAHSSGLGKGAEFIVRLPLDGSGEKERRRGPDSLSPRPKRILVIEDNADLAQSLRDLLELSGHEVTLAHAGLEGLELARRFRPDVLICDIGLPDLNGYEVARAFRAEEALRKVLLVALSGYARPEDVWRAQNAGFDRHLAKPPKMDEMTAILNGLP